MRRLTTAASIVLISLAAPSCEADDVIVRVGGELDTLSIIVIDDNAAVVETLVLEVGDTAFLDASGFNALGQALGDVDPDWYSTDPEVTSVSDEGVVVGVSAGEAEVVATYLSASATAPTLVIEPDGGPPPPPPAASILSPGQDTTVLSGAAVNFQGSASPPEGAEIVFHSWNFGDGITAAVEDPGNHTYGGVGSYDVTYRVTDSNGMRSARSRRTVTVQSESPPPPPPPGALPENLVFASSWSSGTGNGDFAILDGSRDRPWTRIGDMGGGSVRTDASGDFPSDNYMDQPPLAGTMYANGHWSPPAEGEYIAHRMMMVIDGGSSYSVAINTPNEGPNDQFFGNSLSAGQAYEFQVRVRRTTGTQFQMDVAIFSNVTTTRDLVMQTSDFSNWNPPNENLNGFTFSGSAQQMDHLRGISFGLGESIASGDGQHPFHPLEDLAIGAFGSTIWGWHFFPSQNGNGMRFCCISVAQGPTAGTSWPLPPWTPAEESWDPGS